MADELGQVVRQIQREANAEKSDGELLVLFARQGIDAAFEELVRRHGGMVFGVCRRVVGHHHDAEDAFQATFCVLARKAKANQIARPDALHNWIYGVAFNVARKAKAQGLQRRAQEQNAQERQAVTRPENRLDAEATAREWREVLDEELNRLPFKYRALLILCDLEGKTMAEAAGLRQCPVGTIKGELSRAREMLRKRLLKRGLTLSASGLAGLLAAEAATAAPLELVAATVKGMALWSTGATTAGVFSANVVALTEEMMRSILMSKIKIVGALLLAAVFTLGATGGVIAWAAGKSPESVARAPLPNQPVPSPKDDKAEEVKSKDPREADEPKDAEPSLLKMKPLAADPKDDELHKLLKERYNAALAELQSASQEMLAGRIGVEGLFDAATRVKHAGLEVFGEVKDKIALLEKYIELAKEAERIAEARFEAGRVTDAERQRVRYFRADAEIELLRLKGKSGEKPK